MPNESFISRLKHAWNVFTNRDIQEYNNYNSIGNFNRPDRTRYLTGIQKTILASLYNRIAIDAAAYGLKHVRVDKNGRFLSIIDSDLHKVLTLSANTDQTGRALMQDIIMSLFDEGCVAVVPVETDINPETTGGYSIKSLRVGKITHWYPQHIQVNLYNENKGLKEDVLVSKNFTAVIENPLYSVMNEQNQLS